MSDQEYDPNESPFADPQLECADCGSLDLDHVYCLFRKRKKPACLFPLPDGRRCCECAACHTR